MLTTNSLGISVCCATETQTWDSSIVIQLAALDASSPYFLRTSVDKASGAASRRGTEVVMSDEAEDSFVLRKTPGST